MQGERTRKREEEGEEGEQDRRPDRLAHRVRREGGRRGRQREAGQRDRDRDRESDEGSRHPDVQEGPPVRDRIPHADERAERAEGRDRRQEERERRPDVVSLGDDVMAHLVASEDREEGKGEEHGPVADRFGREDRLARVVGPVPSAAEEHDREDRQEEQGDVHLDAREPPLRSPLDVHQRLPLLLGDGRDVVLRDQFLAESVEGRVDPGRRDAHLEGERERRHDDAVHIKMLRHHGPDRLDLGLRGEHGAGQPSRLDKGARVTRDEHRGATKSRPCRCPRRRSATRSRGPVPARGSRGTRPGGTGSRG